MDAVENPSVVPSVSSHLHIAGDNCPWCEQPIPVDKIEEIGGRIAAKQHEFESGVTAHLRAQFDRDRAAADAKAKAELDLARQQVETARREAAVREAAIRDEMTKAGEAAAKKKLDEAELARKELEKALNSKIAEAEQKRKDAEQAEFGVKAQLEQFRAESTQTVEQLKQDFSAKQDVIRKEAAAAAELGMQEKLAEALRAKILAEKAAQESDAQHQLQLNQRLLEQREALENDKSLALNEEKAKAFEEKLKLSDKVQALQRDLEKKTAEELGEGGEINLFESLKEEFPDDRIERVGKGESGADIVHVVKHNSKECGTIVYDSKDRSAWRNDYVGKLAKDQVAAKAEHAILSTNKFPAGARQLHVQDGVIVANPARVVALVQVIRRHIVQGHSMRLSNSERTKKTATLYNFITSDRCGQLFERIDTYSDDLLDLQVKEKKAHDATWKRQGELVRSVQKVRAQIVSEIDGIIGTSDAAE